MSRGVCCVAMLWLVLIARAQTPANDVTSRRSEDPARVAWLSSHMLPLRSIRPADDFGDLMPLKRIIGNARVVQLGEHNHGAGATFYGKQRLVRFLHEEMGFDVLAWEGSLYSCELMDAAVDSDTPIEEVPAIGLLPMWSKAVALPELFAYARSTRKTPHPLHMAGFDIQLSPEARVLYLSKLTAFLRRFDPKLDEAESSELEQWSTDYSKTRYAPTKEQMDARLKFITQLETLLGRRPPAGVTAQELALFRRVVINLGDYERRAFLTGQHRPNWESMNDRDAALGKNLLWLMNERYKGSKMIVWEHNFHLLRHAETVHSDEDPNVSLYRPMADQIDAGLGGRVYSIAFLDYKGSVGSPWQAPVLKEPEPIAGSVESLFHATGRPYGFLDLRSLPKDHWLRSPMIARPGFFKTTVSSVWPDHFDGIFFIDTMFPGDTLLPETGQ
jgi:erythromycin esterase